MIQLKDKKVLVVGFGRFPQGSGISSVRYALSKGARVAVTDKASSEDLGEAIKGLGSDSEKIEWKLGGHDKKDFLAADIIIQNPAIPDYLPELLAARKKGIPIHNDLTLFLTEYEGPILGVTGTRGKSTTSTILWEMIKKKDKRARLGGNIGNSPLCFINELESGVPVILELSSWLLARLPEIKKSPNIAVVTNFFPDHLNVYKGDLAAYLKDKEQIVRYQTCDDFAVLNADDINVRRFADSTHASVFWFSDRSKVTVGGIKRGSMLMLTENGNDIELVKTSELKIPGAHNARNALAASVAAWKFGVESVYLREVLKSFAGLPHRLEEVFIINKVRYIDDSTSTTPDALVAALETIAEEVDRKKRIILIAGGNSKGLSYKAIHPLIKHYVKRLFLIPGTANEQFPPGEEVADLKSSLEQARDLAKPSDIVLFSPGTTWLPGMNEFARGELFCKIVSSF